MIYGALEASDHPVAALFVFAFDISDIFCSF